MIAPLVVMLSSPQARAWSYTAPPQPSRLAPRNAGLVYRPLGASGERYPEWVRELDGEAGVYVIRDADSHEVLYVGSSSTQLYDTLTRHVQQVRHEAQEDPMT
jgi:hypothetical protein